MIIITDDSKCTGCSACVQICPKHCISFNENDYGFRYPIADESACINCGLCDKVCPIDNRYSEQRPLSIYAAVNEVDAIRQMSSSGGVFSAIAETVIERGGVVFGALFDENMEVMHSHASSIDEITKFRGSKYLQSRIESTFIEAKHFLDSGRLVLFSGTPCQIAGLKHFLPKEYDNLLTLDLVCHGVPSPLVWRDYLRYVSKISYKEVTNVSFRNKSIGWKNFCLEICGHLNSSGEESQKYVEIVKESHKRNEYMQLFLHNLSLRPSCYSCPAKGGKSHSDITLGDFWGIGNYYPDADDDKGTSLILVYSKKAIDFLRREHISLKEVAFEQAYKGNPMIDLSVNRSPLVDIFWRAFFNGGFCAGAKVLHKLQPSRLSLYTLALKQYLKRLIYSVFHKPGLHIF